MTEWGCSIRVPGTREVAFPGAGHLCVSRGSNRGYPRRGDPDRYHGRGCDLGNPGCDRHRRRDLRHQEAADQGRGRRFARQR